MWSVMTTKEKILTVCLVLGLGIPASVLVFIAGITG